MPPIDQPDRYPRCPEIDFNLPKEVVVARINGERTATGLRVEFCLDAGIWVGSSLDAFADQPLLENYAACLAKLAAYKNVLLGSGIREIAGTYDASHIDSKAGILYISYRDFTPDGIAGILNLCLEKTTQCSMAAVQKLVDRLWPARNFTVRAAESPGHFYVLKDGQYAGVTLVAGPKSSVVEARRMEKMQGGDWECVQRKEYRI